MQSVGSELKQSTETARRGRVPEREFLHQRCLLALDKALKFAVELTEPWLFRDLVKGGVVAFVPLVFPDMDCSRRTRSAHTLCFPIYVVELEHTKGIIIAHLRPPTAHQVDAVLLNARHAGVPLAHQIRIFIDLIGLDVVHDN